MRLRQSSGVNTNVNCVAGELERETTSWVLLGLLLTSRTKNSFVALSLSYELQTPSRIPGHSAPPAPVLGLTCRPINGNCQCCAAGCIHRELFPLALSPCGSRIPEALRREFLLLCPVSRTTACARAREPRSRAKKCRQRPDILMYMCEPQEPRHVDTRKNVES